MSSPSPVLEVGLLRAAEFPGVGEGIYLNAASVTPLPLRTLRALERANDQRNHICRLVDAEILADLARSRELAARLVGADVDEIALGWNTSYGINTAALSLPIERGSCVVVSDREFPANVYPWMKRDDFRLEIVPADEKGNPDETRLLERLDRGDVSVFAISSVQFSTGSRADLARLGRVCREKGIYFVVDAIQSLGQIPLDVHEAEIDILATGGHKWLCSPYGTGFMYMRRELVDVLEPRMVGWTGMEASADLESLLNYRWAPRRDAQRFEMATLPFHSFTGFAESVNLLLEVGIESIWEHLSYILAPLLEWIESREDVNLVSDPSEAHRSAIVCFRPPQREAVFRRLEEAGVVCSLREGAIRLSPHLYNTRAEIEQVIEILDASRARGWR